MIISALIVALGLFLHVAGYPGLGAFVGMVGAYCLGFCKGSLAVHDHVFRKRSGPA
jgi:hypothetical protein